MRFGRLRSGLRRLWLYYADNRKDALAGARFTPTSYVCAKCGKTFPRTDVHVDHIDPAGSLKDWKDLLPFTRNLFLNKCQTLCATDHAAKTLEERMARAKNASHKPK